MITMGFIRKALILSTAGAVSPNSKKQRTPAQTLAAVQGKGEDVVERAGTRRAALRFRGGRSKLTVDNDPWTAGEIADATRWLAGREK
jgi:hypothetical protein